MPRPWCDKILGTDCASRPRMTGGRGAGFVRLLRRYTPRNDAERNGDGMHRPWCDKILGTDCASRPRMTGGRGVNSSGRSMIEMLGVLAIIGVLSVGGIAGYSKAMEKYKINKVLNEYSLLIYGLIEHLDDLHKLTTAENNSYVGFNDYITSANIVPATWKADEKYNYIMYDSLGNQVNVVSRLHRVVTDLYIGQHTYNDKGNYVSAGFPTALCREIFSNLAQPLHSTLYWARLYRNTETEPILFWGDAACNNTDRKCLNSMTLAEINNICNLCTTDENCCIGLEF